MRRPLVAALSVALAGLSLAAPARASVIDVYQRLAARDVSPAPLVPTTVPTALRPADRTIDTGTTRGGRGYSIRITHYGAAGPDAIIVVTGGEFRSLRALLRDHRRAGFRSRRPMRIRGHRGYLLTRRLGPLNRSLVWVERGVVYSVGSGTPKKVSLAALRSTARGLDRLERDWFGSSSDPDSGAGAFAVTTRRTVSVSLDFEATCAPPGSTATLVRAGSAGVTLVRRQGNRFSFAIDGNVRGSSEPWSGTVTGTISPAAITLEYRVTGTIEGDACDSGPQTITLDRRAQ
jgi:hypothetical protein